MNPDRFADMVCILSGDLGWAPPVMPGRVHRTPDARGDFGLESFVAAELHANAWRQLASEGRAR